MKEARNAVESAPADNQRASLIRATKMNVPSSRLFVDFLFVGRGRRVDSVFPSIVIASPRARPEVAGPMTGSAKQSRCGVGLDCFVATAPHNDDHK
jgi:hypothetical protein